MSLNSLAEFTGASYRLVTKYLVNGKRVLTDSSHISFIRSLEKSVPSNHWELDIDQISVLLYSAARLSSKSGPISRSLCSRLCNICEVLGVKHQDAGISTGSYPFYLDLRNVVVIAWCLDRLSRRDSKDVHVIRAALGLLPSMIHWVDEAWQRIDEGSSMLSDALPGSRFARLSTSLLCMDAILKRCSSAALNDTLISASQQISKSSERLIQHVLAACIKDNVSFNTRSLSGDQDVTFEELYESYIMCSLNVLYALFQRDYLMDEVVGTYRLLLKDLHLSRVRDTQTLVKSFVMLSSKKLLVDETTSIGTRLLDEICTRDMHDVSSEDLLDLIHGCSMCYLQHLCALDAISDALLQRSHCLPGIPWVTKTLQCFRALAYHNPSVLELLLRHVHNNTSQATQEQIQITTECCRALNFTHPYVTELLQMAQE